MKLSCTGQLANVLILYYVLLNPGWLTEGVRDGVSENHDAIARVPPILWGIFVWSVFGCLVPDHVFTRVHSGAEHIVFNTVFTGHHCVHRSPVTVRFRDTPTETLSKNVCGRPYSHSKNPDVERLPSTFQVKKHF